MKKSFLILFLSCTFFALGYYSKKFNFIGDLHSFIKASNSSYDKSEIQRIFKSEVLVFEELTEKVRNFVNSKSIRVSNNEIRNYNENDSKKMIQMMIGEENKLPIKPQLSCSARTLVMQEILNSLGIKSRIVNYFSENHGSHTFLEVLNEKSGKWILEDPDYNVSYRFNGKDKKISLADTIINSTDDFKPCRNDICSWEYAENLKVFTGAGLYFNFDHSPVILINSKKFNTQLSLKWDKKKRTVLKYVNDIWGENVTKAVMLVVN